ncbi:MAG: YicC/YloC family endoribonuclease [Pseudomonadota bacterium]
MLYSMTAFGSSGGTLSGWNWDWELRSVNGRGLDVKLRLPDGFAAMEAGLRKVASAQVSRGSLSAILRLARAGDAGDSIDSAALAAHLGRIRAVQTEAEATGTVLAPMTVSEALALPGVLAGGAGSAAARDEIAEAVSDGFADALDALVSMRAREGAGLAQVLSAALDRIEAACVQAEDLAPERAAHQRRVLQDAIARTVDAAQAVESDRLAQEIALIAVKGDVTEELERLRIHIAAARHLLDASGPAGRKLDFLTQEFNREANTLCSKAQYGPLTQIGLDLKAAIDQIREQVQNVE